MTKGTRNVLLTFAAIFCVVFVGVCMFRRTPIGHVVWPPKHPLTVSDVPVFATPPAYGPSSLRLDLRVRPIAEEHGDILVTRVERWGTCPEIPKVWPVYRYDAITRSLSRVAPSEWKKSGGPIREAGRGDPVGRFLCKEVDGVLKYQVGAGELRDFLTLGEVALRSTYSPNGSIICVLTTDGPERPSSGTDMVFGSVGGGYYGQHYLEFFRLPDMTPIGEAVRIPFTTVEWVDRPCWSPDGRFLVYSNYEGTKMCVIHVDQEGQKP